MKKNTDQVSTIEPQPKQKRIEYTVRIGNHLYKRITRHLILLKHLKSNESKQKWIQEAIEEKLSAEGIVEEFAGDRFMHLKLDERIWNKLHEKVESLKSTRTSVSKKILIEEAIFEKLDREEHKSKTLLKNLLNLSPDD